MGNYENLKQSITEVIRTNGNQEITGAVLQSTLLTIISTVGANATFAGIATPATNPGTPDGLVFYLASESGTYTNFGGAELQDGLSLLTWNGSWSSQQIFGVDDEPTAGSDNLVKSGGVYAKIKAIEDAGYVFSGIATPTTNPGTPDGPVFYLASESGTYTNFNAIELQAGLSVLMWNGSWNSQQIFSVDNEPTVGSDNLVKSGGVQEELALGAVYDVSAKNPTAGVNNDGKLESLSALLSDPNLSTLIPTPVRKGGMSIKFVQSSDNKYVQFRCTADEFSTDISAWQSENVDNEPIENSNNLITSGAVEKKIGDILSKVGPFSITDTNGYIGVVVDNDGLKVKDVYIIINGELIPISNIAKYIKTSSGFYVCDESGYILFGIRNNGTVISKLSNDSCKSIELRGTTYNAVNNKITIPNSAIQIEYAAKLSLPKKINLLQGHVYNLYYEQMLGYGFIRDYKVSETSLPYHPLYYSFLHNSTTVGNTTKTIRLWNGFGYKLEEKSLIINTVNKDTAGSLKICVIGDSMTENPKKLLELANLADKDSNFNITFLGARTSTGIDSEGNTRTIKHCAYSGRNIVDVCQLESYGTNKPNIFFDNTLSTTNKFSISKGITAMGDVPDVIIIDHGANQAVVAWNTVKGCYDFIINDIAAYNIAHNTDIKVVICVQQPGGLIDTINVPLLGSKWGRDYAPTKLMDYVNEYDDRENEGIFLLPQYLIIDPYKDYPRADIPYSERNTSLREIALDNVHMGINMNSHSANHAYSYGEICTDGNDNGYISLKNNNTEPLSDDKVHWAKTKDDVNAGYWKLADIYFAELKYIAGL